MFAGLKGKPRKKPAARPEAEAGTGGRVQQARQGGGLSRGQSALVLLRRKKRPVLLGLLVLAALTAGLSCLFSLRTGEALLILSYEQADRGLNPNGTRFNIYELTSQPVMEQAITDGGLTGALTPEELAERIQIFPSVPKDAPGPYMAAYQIKYTRGGIGEIGADEMLELICQAYADDFRQRYGVNQAVLEYSLGDVSDMEYAVIGELLLQKTRALSRYLSGVINSGGAYAEADTAERLRALRTGLDTLESGDIPDYQAYVLQNGIARDAFSYISTLEYQNMRLSQDYEKSMAAYQNDNEGLLLYSTAPAGEEDSALAGGGADGLAASAQAQLARASDILLEMERNRAMIDRLSSGAPTAEQISRAEEMISRIDARLSDLAAELKEAEQACLDHTVQGYLRILPVEPSVLERLNLPGTVLACLCGLGTAALGAYILQGKRKA